jgi:PAS domain S-box-containing protein
VTSAGLARAKIRDFLSASRREEIIENQYYEIKNLQSKYQKLYDSSPLMYRTISLEGIILECNERYFQYLGYSTKEEVIGHSIFEHVSNESIDALRSALKEWQSTGSISYREIWLKRKDGSTFPARISATNLYDDNGKLIGSNTAITDETDLYIASKEVEKAYQLREEFIRIAAHQLMTPIQPILGFANLAQKGTISHERALEGILVETRKLWQVCSDILDVSRIQSGNLNCRMKLIFINEVIENALQSVLSGSGSALNATDLSLFNVQTEFGENAQLDLDETRMKQALSNIIENAIKFNAKDGKITIATSYSKDRRIFEIRISDCGPGIQEDILPRLFDLFASVNTGENLDKHGSGLGLFISKSIIKVHGGHIYAGNNLGGKGAVFVISLPVPNASQSRKV